MVKAKHVNSKVQRARPDPQLMLVLFILLLTLTRHLPQIIYHRENGSILKFRRYHSN